MIGRIIRTIWGLIGLVLVSLMAYQAYQIYLVSGDPATIAVGSFVLMVEGAALAVYVVITLIVGFFMRIFGGGRE